jgi:ProP effector
VSKNKTRASNAAAFGVLSRKFPKTFLVDPDLRKPLKIGIDTDLALKLGVEVDPRRLRLVLKLYCGCFGYLRNCRPGTERIDLAGEPAGAVTAAEAAHASMLLVELKARMKSKKSAATATPQPPPAPPKLSLTDLRAAARARREGAAR